MTAFLNGHSPERAILVGVRLPRDRERASLWTMRDSLEELAQLATTAGAEVVGTVTQSLHEIDPAYLIGRGKVEELVELCAELQADLVIFDHELSPRQQRNLERALNPHAQQGAVLDGGRDIKVLDRTALILDIFARRARTREGKLQVEKAQYEYLLPRLAGQWSHLERLGGGIGTRGPGESQLETDRRLVRRRLAQLDEELEEVRRQRSLYRRRRHRRQIPVVALVGYTNAGKSTLLNALTDAGVLAENRLFATLDPTTRRIRLPDGLEVLVTDTVGFIQRLPHSLVEAFRATLEEINEADVLIHVLDISHPNAIAQAAAVQQTLDEIGIEAKPVVTALNKIDLLPNGLPVEASAFPHAVPLSALHGYGIEELLREVQRVLASDHVRVTVHIPYRAGRLVELFHQRGVVEREEYTDDGTRITGTLPRAFLADFDTHARVEELVPSAQLLP